MPSKKAALCTWSWDDWGDDPPEHIELIRASMADLARRRGWELVEYFDLVPPNDHRRRPRRDAMLADLRAGKLAAILTEVTTSLAETPCEFATLLAACIEHNVTLLVADESEHVDTSDPTSRRFAMALASLLGSGASRGADGQ